MTRCHYLPEVCLCRYLRATILAPAPVMVLHLYLSTSHPHRFLVGLGVLYHACLIMSHPVLILIRKKGLRQYPWPLHLRLKDPAESRRYQALVLSYHRHRRVEPLHHLLLQALQPQGSRQATVKSFLMRQKVEHLSKAMKRSRNTRVTMILIWPQVQLVRKLGSRIRESQAWKMTR